MTELEPPQGLTEAERTQILARSNRLKDTIASLKADIDDFSLSTDRLAGGLGQLRDRVTARRSGAGATATSALLERPASATGFASSSGAGRSASPARGLLRSPDRPPIAPARLTSVCQSQILYSRVYSFVCNSVCLWLVLQTKHLCITRSHAYYMCRQLHQRDSVHGSHLRVLVLQHRHIQIRAETATDFPAREQLHSLIPRLQIDA